MLMAVYSDSGWSQSIINTSHLIITSQKPGRRSLLDTLRHNADKYNDQQPTDNLQPARAHTHTHALRRDRRSKLRVTAATLASHLKRVSKSRRLPAFNDKRKPKSGAKWKFADPFNKGIPNVSEYSPIPRCWEFGGKTQQQQQCLPQLCPFP